MDDTPWDFNAQPISRSAGVAFGIVLAVLVVGTAAVAWVIYLRRWCREAAQRREYESLGGRALTRAGLAGLPTPGSESEGWRDVSMSSDE